MVVSIITLIWVEIWPTSAIQIAAMAPYFVLVSILTSRVHRNTKLGLYNTASLPAQSTGSDPKSRPLLEPHPTGSGAAHTSSWNSHHPRASVRPLPPLPFPTTAVTSFDAPSLSNTDYSTTRSRLRSSINSLDFGMASS